MKRSKDEEKDENASATNNLNSSTGSNSNDAAAPGGTASAAAAVRTTGRVKKPKQVYDPSDNYVSRGARNTTPASSTVQATPLPAPAPAAVPVAVTQPVSVAVPKPEVVAASSSNAQDADSGPSGQQPRQYDMCQKCTKTEVKRGSGHKSNFLACKSCQKKWHFSCLPTTFDVLAVARKRYKCLACRYCRVCGTKGKDLAICSLCVNSFHRDCHDPPLSGSDLSRGQWKCHGCEFGTNNNNNNSASEPSSGRKSVGRKRRAHSDPAGPEKASPPVKQAKLKLPDSKKNSRKSDADSVAVAEIVATELEPEPANTKNDEPKQDVKVKEKKVSQPQSQLKKEKIKGKREGEKNRKATDELRVPLEPLVVQEINDDTKEDVVINLDEPDEEPPLNPNVPTNQPQEALPNDDFDMPLEIMDQQPLEAAVPIASDDDEIIIVSVQPPPEPSLNIEPMSPVCTWTVEQVTTYLARFYPNEAQILNIQDVDGASLMMLTREDLINGFGLKLGPALRVFQVILGLQARNNNVTLGWSST